MRVAFAHPAPSSRPSADAPVSVVKFGSSVLQSPVDAAGAAAEIARLSRGGAKTVAVVSAYFGETDRLIAEARALSADAPSKLAARLVSLGEERAALGLAIACEAAGLAAAYLNIEAIGLVGAGPDDEADPVSLNAPVIRAALRTHDAVIVPGFAALKDGRHVLLGRGGSDLSAVFLAAELGLETATLVKDVDGVYDRDPAVAGAAAKRYEQLTFEDAARVAGKLVQPRAIRFAESQGVGICVRRLGEDRATLIGPLSPATA